MVTLVSLDAAAPLDAGTSLGVLSCDEHPDRPAITTTATPTAVTRMSMSFPSTVGVALAAQYRQRRISLVEYTPTPIG